MRKLFPDSLANPFHKSVICTLFFLSSLFAASMNANVYKHYNLVYGSPDILISEQAEHLGRTWINGEVYDKPLINRFYGILSEKKEPFVVLDIGAQTGCFSLLSKFCPNSHWYAFEAIQEAADILSNLLEANDIHNVTVCPVAVSNQPGSALLKLPSDNHWGLSTLGADPLRFGEYATRSVECIDLDSFVAKEKISKVDFIKIDVEGWELFVLQGGREMIKRDRPIILMEFNGNNMAQCHVSPDQVTALLADLGYQWELISSEDILCTPGS